MISSMTCEALLIGGIAGLALTAGALAFQSLTSDKKKSEKAKVKEERLAAMATNH
jgi:predicted small secreted protein